MENGNEKMTNDSTAVKTVCFTGHRNMSDEAAERLPDLLDGVIEELCERGATVFRAGGARGFDTLAALKVLEMKEIHPEIRLELVLPCCNQTERWDLEDERVYHYILQNADDCRILFDEYIEGCMQERDRQLVEGSDVCVAYCSHNRGGTAYTYAYAIQEGIEIINLDDLL